MSYILPSALIVVFGYLILSKLETIERRLARQQSILNQLTEDLPEPAENEEIRTLLTAGENVQAIKLAREVYGFSLIEAKQYVDRLNERNS
ncbi:hypothetical protein DV702_10355 [Sporosarcina sp. PTS2304]|uniref:hypothetical protein n=1 Tax=Sporosarcina sp. PTS2304 TaxID=2283194 RepID=UPI000E0D45D8|nr:hypothetical protein [Sporosarcina sp. PTS2304]AXI00082.1 hypothetical protein DV702_10355 [Sporosarcina sp. PTS2304]